MFCAQRYTGLFVPACVDLALQPKYLRCAFSAKWKKVTQILPLCRVAMYPEAGSTGATALSGGGSAVGRAPNRRDVAQ